MGSHLVACRVRGDKTFKMHFSALVIGGGLEGLSRGRQSRESKIPDRSDKVE